MKEIVAQFKQNILKTVDELDLSRRAYYCLKNAGLNTVVDIVQRTEYELRESKNFGRKSLYEIKGVLGDMGLHLGMSLAEIGAKEEALRCHAEAIAIDSSYIPALVKRGNTLLDCGRAEEALHSYDIVLTFEPEHLTALINKGIALDELARYEEALRCYDSALVIDSNNAVVWFNKALALEHKQKKETRFPTKPSEKLQLALFGQSVSLKQSLECYENAVKINPYFTEALYGKGVTLHNLGRDVLALRCLKEALAINPEDYNTWYAQALIQDRLRRNRKAYMSFKTFLSLSPNDMSRESERKHAQKRIEEIEKG